MLPESFAVMITVNYSRWWTYIFSHKLLNMFISEVENKATARYWSNRLTIPETLSLVLTEEVGLFTAITKQN